MAVASRDATMPPVGKWPVGGPNGSADQAKWAIELDSRSAQIVYEPKTESQRAIHALAGLGIHSSTGNRREKVSHLGRLRCGKIGKPAQRYLHG